MTEKYPTANNSEEKSIGTSDICDEELAEVATLISLYRGINMSMYKENYLKRRLAIRIRINGCNNAAQYCNLLRSNDKELDLLVKGLTIHVSQFFRNPSTFEALKKSVFRSLFDMAVSNETKEVKISSIGCAGGEEAYTLAIILRDSFLREIHQIPTTITGFDIDTGSIDIARRGEYADDRLNDIPDVLKEKYFREHDGRYKLVSAIREMVNFQKADMTDPNTYQPADMVLCRNALIYFTRSDQEKILHYISEILPRYGILVLGKSETIVGKARQCFETISMEERIYRKK